jgi:2-keto-4-pentenoate hydratase/2-oxohepta-3-ene-1,7-dioic acid hydratase in catechol pathway
VTATTKLGDFIARQLVNINPGASDATDYLGRACTATTDYTGRLLVNTPQYPPADIARNTAYLVGDVAKLPGTKEVQTLTASGSPTGNLKIDVDRNGSTLKTANIAVATISSANIQSAIVALANVDPGDVTVTGTGPYTLTWESELDNVAQVAADNTGVSGGSYAAATTTQGAVLEQIFICTVAGTTHASTKPAPPAVADTVTDGTVTWRRLK